MRTHLTVAPGQLWQSSDRRRLSAFRILHIGPAHDGMRVLVNTVYPPDSRNRDLPIERFLVTGSKGYTRVA